MSLGANVLWSALERRQAQVSGCLAVFGLVTTTLPPPSGADKARLLRRAQLVARLRHPNLVRMLPLPGGAGLAPVLNDAKRLADFTLPAGTFKRFDLEQVVRLLLDVLSGLAALHEVESDGTAFVHGEAAPCNVYVDEHGTARLVPLLSSHLFVGARPEANGYVAPERLGGDAVDCRADVFSVGAMLWEALAGQRLFPDPTPEGVATRLAEGRVPPIQLNHRLAWAKPLCRIAERAIAANREARFATALELSNAIAAAAAQQLSKVDSDAWQEEAPTPVFQPGLHLATLRATTLHPQVLDVPPAIALIAPRSALPSRMGLGDRTDVTGVKEEPTLVMGVKDDAAQPGEPPLEAMPAWQQGRRGRGLLLGALAIVLVGVGVTAPRVPGLLQRVERSAGSAALWLGTSRLPVTEPPPPPVASQVVAAPPTAADVAVASSSAVTALSASSAPVAPRTSSAPALSSRVEGPRLRLRPAGAGTPEKSTSTPHPQVPVGAPPPRLKSKGSGGNADYGI